MNNDPQINWLHLSDLHVGMSAQGWLWPNFKDALREDLARLHDKTGPWDLVIFSGDLTQKASSDEFARLNDVLGEIWSNFGEFGSDPALFPVPGNHDLKRPDKRQPVPLLLGRWWEEEELREEFWSGASAYRECIEQIFTAYSDWLKSCPLLKRLPLRTGLLPGDVSATLTLNNHSLGLVGLNTAWLQLTEGDFERRLNADVRQLLAVTDDDPPNWCRRHDINLIVTHHPVGWLHEANQSHWRSEIAPPGRFDAHLFGHMHDPDVSTTYHAGSDQKTVFQAPSLFGLEKHSGGQFARIQGYLSCRASIDGDGRAFRVWPRRLVQHLSGKTRLTADQSFELDEDNSFTTQFPISGSTDRGSPNTTSQNVARLEVAPVGDEETVLERIRHHTFVSKSHLQVRLAEQEQCAAGLREKRAVWLQTEWGLGSDGFIASVQRRLGSIDAPIYRFELTDYVDRDRFLDSRQWDLASNILPN